MTPEEAIWEATKQDWSRTGAEIYTYTHKGHVITVEWDRDQDMGVPWKEHDGHGIVSDWTRRDKYPGERLLHQEDRDYGSKRYYDVEATMKLAKKDGWGLTAEDETKLAEKLGHKPTKKEIVAEAVDRDFEFLRAWCSDEWEWKCRLVTIKGFSYRDSLCGIEGTDETVREYTIEAIQQAIKWLDHELLERQDAANRDIITEP